MLLIPVTIACLTLAAAQPPVPPLSPGNSGQQFGPQRDPRGTLPEAAGTAIVRGRVVTADGRPIKRVAVTLNQTGTSDFDRGQLNQAGIRLISRTAMTDAQGQFQFDHLPAGFYRLSARPGQFQAQFLMGAYGQQRPDQPGPPFEMTDGQVFTSATIVMPRSGVISGRVTDDEGEPVARVPVATFFFAPGASSPSRNTAAQTDDQGRFRLFGLQPGSYLVVADVRNGGGFGLESDTDSTGFMTTYFPGVPSEAEAQRVEVGGGGETSGVDFRLLRGRLFTVTGTVISSQGQPVFPANVMLTANVGRPESRVVEGFSTDQQGRFTLRAVAPGDYALVIRPRVGPRQTMIMNGRQVPDLQEFANVSLHVDSDISDFVITTRPTLTISGRVIFAEGPPPAVPGQPDPLRNLRISAAPPPGAGIFSSGGSTQVNPDLTFVLKGLSSAAIVRAGGLPRNFTLKQVLVGTEDITDRPHEFVDRDSGELQVVVTSRVGGIEGTVVDDGGKPAVDAMVLLLLPPEEGRATGLYRTGNTDPRGHFRIDDLRAGSFAVIAVPRERMPRGNDPDALSALAREAQALTLNDGEFRVLDLKVNGGG